MCNSLWSVLLTSVKERKREQHTLHYTHATPVQHMQQSFLCWKHTKLSNEKGANDIGRENNRRSLQWIRKCSKKENQPGMK